jgi:hypothetical protein
VRSVDERDKVFILRETPAKDMLAGRQNIEFLKYYIAYPNKKASSF